MHIRGVQKIENLSAVGGREWRQKFGGTCQTCRFHMIDLFSFIFFGRDGVLGIFCGGYDYSRHEPNGKSDFCTPLMHICSIIMMEWRYSWASNITMEEERETIKKHTQTIERECCLDGKRLRGICYLCSSVSII